MSRPNCSRRNSLSRKSYESLPFRSDSPERRFDDSEDRCSSRRETRRRYSIQEVNRRSDDLEHSHHHQSQQHGLDSRHGSRDRRSNSLDKKSQHRSGTSNGPRERLERLSIGREVLHGRSSRHEHNHAGDRHERREGRRSVLNSEAERRRREQRAKEERERRFSKSDVHLGGSAGRRDSGRRRERRMSKSEHFSRSDFDVHGCDDGKVREEKERRRRDGRRERRAFSKSDNGLDFNDESEQHRRDRARTETTTLEADLHDRVSQILDQISHIMVKTDLDRKNNCRNDMDSHQSDGSQGGKVGHPIRNRHGTGKENVVAESACTSPTAASSVANSTISSLGQSAHFEAEFLASIRTLNEHDDDDKDLGSLLNGSGQDHFIERKNAASSAVVKSAPVTPVTSKDKVSILADEDLGSLVGATCQEHLIETKKVSGDDALASLKSKLFNPRPFKSKESVSAVKTQGGRKSEFSLFLKKSDNDCKSPPVTPNSQTKPRVTNSASGMTKPATTLPPPPLQKKTGLFAPLRKSNSQPTEKPAVTRVNVPPPPQVPLPRRPMHSTRAGAVPPPPPPPPVARRPIDTKCTSDSVPHNHHPPNATTILKRNGPTPPPPSRNINNNSSKVPPLEAKSAPTTPVSSPPIQPKPTLPPEQRTKLINPNNNRRQKHVTNMPHTDQFGEFGFYTGEVDEDVRPHGHGKMKYENGVFYEGKWNNGNQDSSAVLQRERMLSGFTSWRGVQKKEASGGNGACHVYGMAWIDNAGLSGKYTGKVNDKNLPHGMGKMIYDMGLIAEGEWVHGVLNGAAQSGQMMGAGATVVPGGTVMGGGMSVIGGGGMSIFPGMTIMGGMQAQAPGMCFGMTPPSTMDIPASISVQQNHEQHHGSSHGTQGSIVFC